MDAQETELYNILKITYLVIGAVLLYAFITAILQQLRYRVQYHHEIETEILASENERRWLAADMHDELGPLLSATRLSLSAIQTKEIADASLLNESVQHIDEISSKVRSLARGLMPNILLDKGLAMAAEQFIKSLGSAIHLSIKLEIEPLPPLNINASIHLYRIIQEIIHNSVKHAHANRLIIKLYIERSKLILAASDDGIGFNNTKNQKTQGSGLTGIQNRIHLLNGQLNLRSSPGTSYYVLFPLAALKEKAGPETV